MNAEPHAAKRTRRPLTALEYLDTEEKRAIDDLKNSLVAAGEELSQKADLHGVVTRHPALAMGASAVIGAALAPLVMDALRVSLPTLLGRGGHSGKALGNWLTDLHRAP